jgi:hypothetical protein
VVAAQDFGRLPQSPYRLKATIGIETKLKGTTLEFDVDPAMP